MKPVKTAYYTDPLNDEFSGNKIEHRPLPADYKYIHKNPFYRATAWFLYYLILYPIAWIAYKVFLGYCVKGNKRIKGIMRKPVFFYGNHTSWLDAGIAQFLVSRGKRTYIITNQDTTSIKGIRGLVSMIGAIPTPLTPEEREKFVDCIRFRAKQKCGISIFPEAHIWPYSTHIRPFKDDAFVYPAELGAPVVAMCVTYRERKFRKSKPPLPVVHVSKPFFPDMDKSLTERKKELRQAVYDYLVETAASEENVEYISYRPIEEKPQ